MGSKGEGGGWCGLQVAGAVGRRDAVDTVCRTERYGRRVVQQVMCRAVGHAYSVVSWAVRHAVRCGEDGGTMRPVVVVSAVLKVVSRAARQRSVRRVLVHVVGRAVRS